MSRWSLNDLEAALKDIREKKTSIRAAAVAHGVPKVHCLTMHLVEQKWAAKRGPDTILTAAKEKLLVDYTIHMAEIGNGRTREQVCNMVKSTLDKDGRPNPFKKNKPGRGQGAARGLSGTGRLVDSSSYDSSFLTRMIILLFMVRPDLLNILLLKPGASKFLRKN